VSSVDGLTSSVIQRGACPLERDATRVIDARTMTPRERSARANAFLSCSTAAISRRRTTLDTGSPSAFAISTILQRPSTWVVSQDTPHPSHDSCRDQHNGDVGEKPCAMKPAPACESAVISIDKRKAMQRVTVTAVVRMAIVVTDRHERQGQTEAAYNSRCRFP